MNWPASLEDFVVLVAPVVLESVVDAEEKGHYYVAFVDLEGNTHAGGLSTAHSYSSCLEVMGIDAAVAVEEDVHIIEEVVDLHHVAVAAAAQPIVAAWQRQPAAAFAYEQSSEVLVVVTSVGDGNPEAHTD